jgi:ketosteroid isomerase-like protein
MKKLILFFAILMSSYIGFAQEKEIKNLLEQQRSGWNKGDMEAYMQGYWKSDSLLFIGRSGPDYGWQKTLESYKKFYPDKASMGYLTFDIKEIKMIDKNHAFVLGAWNIKKEKDEAKGFFTLIVQKFKDGWKVIVDHSS